MTTEVHAPEEPHKRFHLRTLPGIDGATEVVAEGIHWSSGAVALHHAAPIAVTAVYASMDDLLRKLGDDHDVVWVDKGVEWTVADFADHGAAKCEGVGA